MIYPLSNIARACIIDRPQSNILYFANKSAIDSVINSLPNINIITPKTYWISDIQAIVYYPDSTTIDEDKILLQYHRPILKIADCVQDNTNNNYIFIDFDKIDIIKNQNKDKKLLLYILDNDQSKATIGLEYLNSLQINYTVFDPSQFINIGLFDLQRMLSEFRFVLNNTNINNLILANSSGATPITFMPDLVARDSRLNLVDENNFIDTISSPTKTQYQKTTGQTELMLADIISKINQYINRPFIL